MRDRVSLPGQRVRRELLRKNFRHGNGGSSVERGSLPLPRSAGRAKAPAEPPEDTRSRKVHHWRLRSVSESPVEPPWQSSSPQGGSAGALRYLFGPAFGGCGRKWLHDTVCDPWRLFAARSSSIAQNSAPWFRAVFSSPDAGAFAPSDFSVGGYNYRRVATVLWECKSPTDSLGGRRPCEGGRRFAICPHCGS